MKKNSLVFAKDVQINDLNFVAIAVTFSEKKIGAYTSIPPHAVRALQLLMDAGRASVAFTAGCITGDVDI